MKARCQVKLEGGNKWRDGTLGDEVFGHPGEILVSILGLPYAPVDVTTVRVFADCPAALLDAAVNAGYHVVGQPAGEDKQR